MLHPEIPFGGHSLTTLRTAAVEIGRTSRAGNVTFDALEERWFIGRYSATGTGKQMK